MIENKFADYWRYDIGANVIPAVTATKKPLVEWKKWQIEPISEEMHQEWKNKNLFKNGMAVICGHIFHNDSKKGWWLNGIDCDNLMGLQEICIDSIERVAKNTLVEQHSNKEKGHIYFYTKSPIQSQTLLVGTNIPQIEVKSGSKFLLYCAGGTHKDGSPIEILNCKEPALVEKEQLENKIDNVFKKYGLTYLEKKLDLSISKPIYQIDSGKKLEKGSNRGKHILSYLDSKLLKNPELDKNDLIYFARKYESEYCSEKYDDIKIESLVDQAIKFCGDKLKERQVLEESKFKERQVLEKYQGEHAIAQLGRMYIIDKKMVVKSGIIQNICQLIPTIEGNKSKPVVEKIIGSLFEDRKIFQIIKQHCKEYGDSKFKIVFDNDQLIEVSHWIMGAYYFKRIELTGKLIYHNQYYEKTTGEFIKRVARECLIKSRNSTMNEIVGYIADSAPLISNLDIAKDVHLKCLNNGTYNIITGEFVDSFDPKNIILNQIPHNYDKNAIWIQIDRKVSEIISNKEDKQSFYDFLSTCLHPYTGIDLQFGGVGEAGTGKSQLGELSIMVLGSKNVSNASIHQIAIDSTIQQDIAYNFLNIDSEMSDDIISKMDILKKWITQDPFNGRSIYEHSVQFRPTCRLGFMANEIYDILKKSDAIAMYERTYLMTFNNKFRTTEKEIKNVFAKVATESELDGFITYLLNNATEIYKRGNITFPQSTATTESIWDKFGNRLEHFVDNWLIDEPHINCSKSKIWEKWIQESHKKGLWTGDKTKFFVNFETKISKVAKKIRIGDDTVWGYENMRLNDEIKMEKFDSTNFVPNVP